jgi:hypothetical protein
MLGLLVVGATAGNNLRYTGIGGNNYHKNGGIVGGNNGEKNCDKNGGIVGGNNGELPNCEEQPAVNSNDDSGRVDANTGSQVRIIA